MSEQFVILHHTGHGEDHFDFMLDLGQALATWRLADNPAGDDAPSAQPALRLPDHRRAYLEHQGPVSRHRGEVTRVEQGTYETSSHTATAWEFRLHGAQVEGGFRLERVGPGPDDWRLSRVDVL